MKINFFDGFTVVLDETIKESSGANIKFNFLNKTTQIASDVMHCLRVSFKESKSSAINYFKIVVIAFPYKSIFGSYGEKLIFLPGGLLGLCSRVCLYVNLMGLNFFNLCVKNYHQTSTHQIEAFISEGLDPSHFLIKNKEINVEGVPESVKVSNLLQIYDDINFDDPNRAGYLKTESRFDPDYNRSFSKDELKKHLIKFVNHVENRIAFLGTPSEYDIAGLNEYYSYLENVVRVCINKSNDQIKEFKEGKDLNNLSDEDKKTYSNLLEDRARIAINLGIAGAHCGGRYSSESLELYDTFMHTENFTNSDLKECLNSILAQERTSIAREEIYRLFGVNTHDTAAYYQEFGEILGLPNTKGIVEHLKKINNRKECLHSFFKKYTDDRVVNVIYDAIEKDQILREKIQDWLKSEINDWAKEEYAQKASKCIDNIQTALNSDDNKTVPSYLAIFASIFNSLSTNAKNDLKSNKEFNKFLEKFLGKDEVKQILNKQNRIELNRLSHIPDFAKEALKKIICDKDSIKTECLEDIAVKLNKISDIEKIIRAYEINLDKEVLNRILEGKADLKDVIESQFDKLREYDFTSKFKLQNLDYYETEGEEIGDKELKLEKAKIIEWLLVKHGILKPQNSIVKSHKKIDLADRKKEILDFYLSRLSKIDDIDYFLIQKIERCFFDNINGVKSNEETELVASEILSELPSLKRKDGDRFRFRFHEAGSEFEKLKNYVFLNAIKNDDSILFYNLASKKSLATHSIKLISKAFIDSLIAILNSKPVLYLVDLILLSICCYFSYKLFLKNIYKIYTYIPSAIFEPFNLINKILNPFKNFILSILYVFYVFGPMILKGFVYNHDYVNILRLVKVLNFFHIISAFFGFHYHIARTPDEVFQYFFQNMVRFYFHFYYLAGISSSIMPILNKSSEIFLNFLIDKLYHISNLIEKSMNQQAQAVLIDYWNSATEKN